MSAQERTGAAAGKRTALRLARYCLPLLVILLVLAAARPAAAVEAKNIAVSAVGETSAVLVVATDVPGGVLLEYGNEPGVYTGSKIDAGGTTRHELALDGLDAGETVYYRLTLGNDADPADTAMLPEASFRTARPAGEPFIFGVCGDNRPNSDTTVQPSIWNSIVTQMAAEDLDLVLSVGDIIFGLDSDSAARASEKYDGYFAVTSALTARAPLYVAAGNHERLSASGSRQAYEDAFTFPVNDGAEAATYGEEYYSFDVGDTHFIALCTEIPGQEGMITGAQKSWLENDLAATDAVWIVVFMHRPLFSGLHLTDPWMNPLSAAGQQNRDEIETLFRNYGVDIVFEGHEHHYLHHLENGIHYVITGGGGAPLSSPLMADPGDIFGAASYEHVRVEESTSSLKVTALDAEGATLESFTVWALDLELAAIDTRWNSYSDYLDRRLSVDYRLGNGEDKRLLAVQVYSLDANNGATPLTEVPVSLGDLDAGATVDFTVQYQVPPGVVSFTAATGVSCGDEAGNQYAFPGPAAAS